MTQHPMEWRIGRGQWLVFQFFFPSWGDPLWCVCHLWIWCKSNHAKVGSSVFDSLAPPVFSSSTPLPFWLQKRKAPSDKYRMETWESDGGGGGRESGALRWWIQKKGTSEGGRERAGKHGGVCAARSSLRFVVCLSRLFLRGNAWLCGTLCINRGLVGHRWGFDDSLWTVPCPCIVFRPRAPDPTTVGLSIVSPSEIVAIEMGPVKECPKSRGRGDRWPRLSRSVWRVISLAMGGGVLADSSTRRPVLRSRMHKSLVSQGRSWVNERAGRVWIKSSVQLATKYKHECLISSRKTLRIEPKIHGLSVSFSRNLDNPGTVARVANKLNLSIAKLSLFFFYLIGARSFVNESK